MANESVVNAAPRSSTTCTPFGDLFQVRAGVDANEATRKAASLAESIEYLANDATQSGMTEEVAALVAFAAESIRALMHSVDGGFKSAAGA